MVDGSIGKLMSKSNYSLLSSFQVKFERVVNGLEGQNNSRGQSKHGLWGSSVKIWKNLLRTWQEQIMCTFSSPEGKKHYLWWDTTYCTPHIVYINAGVSKNYKSSKRIELSWFILHLLNFTDLRPPSLRVGWVEAVSEYPTHMCTYMCMYMHTWLNKIISIANVCLHRNGFPQEILIMTSLHMHLCVCACMHACVRQPSIYPQHHPPTPIPRGDPLISKNSVIIQLCLKIWNL